MAVPRLGRLKNSEKQLSQTWEERKTVKNSCPKLGKNEKHCRQSFPPLGNRKMLKINSSLVSEMQKTRKTVYCPRAICRKREKTGCCEKKLNPKVFYLTFGVRFYFDTLFFIFSLQIYFKACSMSAIMSSTFSMPTERRIKSGAIPASRSCSSVS